MSNISKKTVLSILGLIAASAVLLAVNWLASRAGLWAGSR